MNWYDELLIYAERLPAGMTDPRALQKLRAEEWELRQAIAEGDLLGAIMKAGDCLYYAAKSAHNEFIHPTNARLALGNLSRWTGVPASLLLMAAKTKFYLRAQPGNPQNDTAERAAVAYVIREEAGWRFDERGAQIWRKTT